MPFLPAIGQEARPEGGGAFAAGMADALVEDTVRTRIAELRPEPLRMDIAVRIIEMRVAVRETANVVETGLEVDGIDAHVDLLGGLVGPLGRASCREQVCQSV